MSSHRYALNNRLAKSLRRFNNREKGMGQHYHHHQKQQHQLREMGQLDKEQNSEDSEDTSILKGSPLIVS